MNISKLDVSTRMMPVQNFKGKSFVRYNETTSALSDYTTEHIIPRLNNLHGIAKQYNLPVTIAELGKKTKGVALLNNLYKKLGIGKSVAETPQVVNRLLVNVGAESRFFDPNEIPLDKISGKIEDFVREVSEKRMGLSKPLSEQEKLNYIKEHLDI